MNNPFQVQYSNPFTKTTKPIISKGSPLLGNGKIHNFNLPSLRPMGTDINKPFLSKSKQVPVWTRPWQVNTPQPLVQTMVKTESLREIFNDAYYKELFEMNVAGGASPMSAAPIGGAFHPQHDMMNHFRRVRRMPGFRRNLGPRFRSYHTHINNPGQTPVHLLHNDMGSAKIKFKSGMV